MIPMPAIKYPGIELQAQYIDHEPWPGMAITLPVEIQFGLKPIVSVITELQFPTFVGGDRSASFPQHAEGATRQRIS